MARKKEPMRRFRKVRGFWEPPLNDYGTMGSMLILETTRLEEIVPSPTALSAAFQAMHPTS